MNISDIGEFGFIDAIKGNTIYNDSSVVIGIGDDGAVYKTTAGMEQVAVIDTMVENSHFIIGRTATWYDVGFKAVASNLSDIAAMGAVPTHLVLSTAIAPSMAVEELKSMYTGIKDICKAYKVNILGGDTVTSKEGMVLTVSAFGEIEAGRAIRRSGAKEGDIVAVSHTIGNSSGGLDVLLTGAKGFPLLRQAHCLPQPQIALGRLLVKHQCHSLNDISDGLASESNEIAKASHVDLLLQRNLIPRSNELIQWSQEQHKDSWNFVFNGGEDYELIFTMTAADFAALQYEYPEVTKIGIVRSGEGKVYLHHDDQDTILPAGGWTHF